MYSWTQFRKDFFPAVWIAIGLMITFAIGLAVVANVNLVVDFLKHPWEVSGGTLLITGLLVATLLCYRSWFFIAHQGWKRLLLLVALVAFAWPIAIQLSGRSVGLDDFFEGFFAGGALAAVVIAAPQLLFLIIRWVKSGFESASSDGDPQ